ncbi:UDP-N-acetylmuramoyl-tripeptide--D-alanyl-D-alanine ligase [Pedobacter psychrotolerans]|uniref:Alanine racemase n=1 Tax=Pedobacter psychrotolerans TaxID=1843235 RepID=A0A4R2H6F7_9SPHI|nr:bifunctional UDP-N-acetylmuramoyl-tripeptide:D-alanyl-D-alanine ligase/alanine racemase [Pedobacter psychrotolerans]TCO21677.1 UDP-N-acetylmuramoyl-tripeptide--D-alanyl-D-alanine ligase [Pedobacter psychrotolerans]GGE40323.1 bifunctional UDP-N-acetylmuramoyl-tripeptide:D-alanyl-D-alanine ligase/alanine racemase [Pedobacter psychrotolerans]
MLQNPIYTLSKIAEILRAEVRLVHEKVIIQYLIIDSRSVMVPENSLFFALSAHRDGHEFIRDAYHKQVRNFVITEKKYITLYPDCNFIIVEDSLVALQLLALIHRKHFDLKTIGITGSNGKTIVKEWLYQLLALDFNIIRSPKSYNSQIGVPLSVWQINASHNLGIFEAGISAVGEMGTLAKIIQPQIGILTNIGEAHAEGFASKKEKLVEKLKLFTGCELLIYSPDYVAEVDLSALPVQKKFSWSGTQGADLRIIEVEHGAVNSHLRAIYQDQEISCILPFKDKASIENGIICWATLLAFGYSPEQAGLRLEKLTPVSMRLELKNGINQCSIIDDSYSADISSLAIALDFLNQQNQHAKKTVILSELFETGKDDLILYTEIADLLQQKRINRLIGIGKHIAGYAALFKCETQFFVDTDAFMQAFPGLHFNHETILVKGARRFEFGRISKILTQKIHDTVLEIDLNAMVSNLQFYRSKLSPGVKIMAMVKAFSYGSGSFEIANLLQFHKVDYLAVAYADEGIALRKAGITLPIMVMSPEESAFEAIIKHHLEPEIYSLEILNSFLNVIPKDVLNYPVHLKIDSGMHRLGFDQTEVDDLCKLLINNEQISVQSIFSHLVASGEAEHDGFTREQMNTFDLVSKKLIDVLGYKPLLHIANTSGISRWPDSQLDMVRLGIGLYGFDTALYRNQGLQTVMVLKTTITQVKTIAPGESVGYSRKGWMRNGGKIATVKIGYADGYSRAFGNGVGKMLVNGQLVPTIGSICMDMTMLDITGLDVSAGDEAIVFNHEHTIMQLASDTATIPYEILTNISQRVKRVYFYE